MDSRAECYKIGENTFLTSLVYTLNSTVLFSTVNPLKDGVAKKGVSLISFESPSANSRLTFDAEFKRVAQFLGTESGVYDEMSGLVYMLEHFDDYLVFFSLTLDKNLSLANSWKISSFANSHVDILDFMCKHGNKIYMIVNTNSESEDGLSYILTYEVGFYFSDSFALKAPTHSALIKGNHFHLFVGEAEASVDVWETSVDNLNAVYASEMFVHKWDAQDLNYTVQALEVDKPATIPSAQGHVPEQGQYLVQAEDEMLLPIVFNLETVNISTYPMESFNRSLSVTYSLYPDDFPVTYSLEPRGSLSFPEGMEFVPEDPINLLKFQTPPGIAENQKYSFFLVATAGDGMKFYKRIELTLIK